LKANPVSLSDFRNDLPAFVDRCERGDRIIITRHGAKSVVLVSAEEWDEITETLAIIGDPDLFKQLVASARDVEAGHYRPAKDVFRDLDAEA
jgi:prevent-host-death family protein